MRIVQLTSDNREVFRKYDLTSPQFGAAPDALLSGFAHFPKHEIHVVSCSRKEVNSPTKLAENIWFHSVKIPRFGMLKTAYLPAALAIRKRLVEINPDIVHGQGTERDCAISSVLSGFPNVLTIHGNMGELARLHREKVGSFYWLQSKLEDFCLRRTIGVFCNSDYTEGLVAPRSRRVWKVPNAIRPEFFVPKTSAASKLERPVLLNIGVVSPRKRQVELLQMATELYKRGHSFEIHFVGSLDHSQVYPRKFIESLQEVEHLGFAKHFDFMERDELISKIDSSNALVHFPFEEAFGLVVAEAMVRGLKLFASDLGGIRDIAGKTPGAELIPSDRFDVLGERIALWLMDGADSLPEASRMTMHRYHPEKIAALHLEIYREVISL